MRKVCLSHAQGEFSQLPAWAGGSQGQPLVAALGDQGEILAFPTLRSEICGQLEELAQGGRSLTWLPCDEAEGLSVEALAKFLTPEVRTVILPHAGEFCGALLPVEEAGALCQARGVKLIVDMARTAGRLPICPDSWPAEGILLGGRVLGPTEALLRQLAGGAELSACRDREIKLTGHLMARMRELEPDGLQIPGPREAAQRAGQVSILFPGIGAIQATHRLKASGITVEPPIRTCPSSAGGLAAAPDRLVRMSLGQESTFEEMDYVQGVVIEIMGL